MSFYLTVLNNTLPDVYRHFLKFASFVVHPVYLYPTYHKFSLSFYAQYYIYPFQILCQYRSILSELYVLMIVIHAMFYHTTSGHP